MHRAGRTPLPRGAETPAARAGHLRAARPNAGYLPELSAMANQPLLISTPLSFVVEHPPSSSAAANIVAITVNFFILAEYWRIAPEKAIQ